MICPYCGTRWAPLPDNWPDVRMTEDEDKKRQLVFTNDKPGHCPCREEVDQWPTSGT